MDYNKTLKQRNCFIHFTLICYVKFPFIRDLSEVFIRIDLSNTLRPGLKYQRKKSVNQSFRTILFLSRPFIYFATKNAIFQHSNTSFAELLRQVTSCKILFIRYIHALPNSEYVSHIFFRLNSLKMGLINL